MLNVALWTVICILVVAALVYAVRRRKGEQGTTYVRPDTSVDDEGASKDQIESELNDLIRQVKQKLRKEMAGGGQ